MRRFNQVGCCLATIAVALVLATDVRATTLTFDDLPTAYIYGSFVPNGYGGLNWSNMDYLNPATVQYPYPATGSGYQNGMLSSPNVAFNGQANPVIVNGDQFTFNSAYFTGAWNDGLTISIEGYKDSGRPYTATFTVNTTSPTLEVFNWTGLNTLVFTSNGGVNHGYGDGGFEFAMDNMTINEVPEPPALVLLTVGAVSLLAYAWRRRTKAA
jgi:hypothetical protein